MHYDALRVIPMTCNFVFCNTIFKKLLRKLSRLNFLENSHKSQEVYEAPSPKILKKLSLDNLRTSTGIHN